MPATKKTKVPQGGGNRRADILAAAAEQFADRGLAGVSMRDIAAAVGFNMSALYHHFASKADLYRDVCIWALEYANNYSASRLYGEGDAQARLKSFIAALVNFVEDNGVAARIIQQEMLLSPSGLLDYPSIIKDMGLQGTGTSLADFITELNPPILEHISGLRLAEMIWDATFAIARYRPAHIRLIGRKMSKKDEISTVAEVWIMICKLLDLPLDEPGGTR